MMDWMQGMGGGGGDMKKKKESGGVRGAYH